MSKAKFICERCVIDSDLQEVVRHNLCANKCTYCRRRGKALIACTLSKVIERIRFAVDQFYTSPGEFAYWDSREGGWQGIDVYDGFDLFDNIDWGLTNQSLIEDIVGSFGDRQFAMEDQWSGPFHVSQLDSWEQFKAFVKHKRRYTFLNVKRYPSTGVWGSAPKDMLSSFDHAIRFAGLTKALKPGEEFWRVRVHGANERLLRSKDLSSPPQKNSIYPNRMSPSGIPMFYGADDLQTALIETIDPTAMGLHVTGGVFENLQELSVLDLTDIPDEYGFFSAASRDVREAVEFFRGFSNDISQPITKNGSEHTEYVPTQVFTEFVRHEVRTPAGKHFDGIKYRSSKNGRGCYVLFLIQKQCLSCKGKRKRPQVLRIRKDSRRTLSTRAAISLCRKK